MSTSTPTPSTGETGPSLPWWRRPVTWVVAAIAVVVAVVVAVAVTRDDAAPEAGGTPSASASASPTPSEGPTESAEPTEPSEPAEPEEGADGGEGAGGEAAGDPGAARPTAPPVALDAPAQPAPQVTATLSRLEAVQGEANLPGEVGGPSLRVTVAVANGTDAELDLTTAVVNLYHGAERDPAITLLEPGHRDFPASVAPGREATGTFVFLVPEDRRGDVLVELDLSTQADVVLFTGAAPV